MATSKREGLEYAKKQLVAGLSEREIRLSFSKSGWQEEDINQIFEQLQIAGEVTQISQHAGGVLMSAGALFSGSFKIYFGRWGIFLATSLLPPAFFILALIVVGGGFVGLSQLGLTGSLFSLASISISEIILLAVLGFGVFILSSLTQIVTAKHYNTEVGFKGILKIALSKVFRYAWTSFLVGFFVLVIFLAFVLLGGFVLNFGIGLAFSGGITLALFALQIVALLFPGVVVWIWISFSIFIAVFEDVSGFKAIRRSREYVRGRFWKVFWRIMFIFLISIILNIIITFSGKIPLLYGILSILYMVIFPAIIVIYNFKLYDSLRATKKVT